MKNNDVKESFQNFYKELNYTHKRIVFDTLQQMKKKANKTARNESEYEIIKDRLKNSETAKVSLAREYLKQEDESYYDDIDKLYNEERAIENALKRNSGRSKRTQFLKDKFLSSSDEQTLLIKQCLKNSNIDWLFNSITADNQKVILTLTIDLYILQNCPEYYNEDYLDEL